MRGSIAWLLCFAVTACGKAPNRMTNAECRIPSWRAEQPDPPNRVAFVEFRQVRGGVVLNGKHMSEADALVVIRRLRDNNPSAYLLLRRNPSEECGNIKSLAQRIDRSFDCRHNYCFYPRMQASVPSVDVQP